MIDERYFPGRDYGRDVELGLWDLLARVIVFAVVPALFILGWLAFRPL